MASKRKAGWWTWRSGPAVHWGTFSRRHIISPKSGSSGTSVKGWKEDVKGEKPTFFAYYINIVILSVYVCLLCSEVHSDINYGDRRTASPIFAQLSLFLFPCTTSLFSAYVWQDKFERLIWKQAYATWFAIHTKTPEKKCQDFIVRYEPRTAEFVSGMPRHSPSGLPFLNDCMFLSKSGFAGASQRIGACIASCAFNPLPSHPRLLPA